MPLKFTCPDGHTITCPEKMSGKRAKCPKCSVKFVVPPPGQPQADPVSANSQAADSNSNGDDASADSIEFLCPNGHKLNGPSSLQGKPGQCPDCGAKFRIPSYEEFAAMDDEFEDDEILTGEVVDDDELVDTFDMEQLEIVDDEMTMVDDFEELEEVTSFPDVTGGSGTGSHAEQQPAEHYETVEPELDDLVPALPAIGEGDQAIAEIFTMLWQQREFGGKLELQLEGGELLLPDRFCPDLSRSSHAVFALEGTDRSFTIVSVPWATVQRVSLRKTSDLPPGLFIE